MSKISAYNAIASVQVDDLLAVVDVHDTAMAPSGTTKKMTVSQLPFLSSSQVGAAGGVASLDSGSKVPAAQIPQLQAYAPTGLTGASAPTRYGGGTVSGHPLSGTWSAGDWVADQQGHIYACVAGGTPGTWRRVGADPWQFFLDDYCAGDGKVIGDATISAGSLNTLTSATAAFSNADTGKHVMLNGGQGDNAQPLITTITYVSATTVTLAAPATGAVTDASAIYGSDDVANIKACLADAKAYALANNYQMQVIGGDKLYCLVTPPGVTSGIAGSTTCQIPLPAAAASGATRKLIGELLGAGPADDAMYWEAVIPGIQGTCLVSMCIPPFSSGTNPYPSVIGYEYAADGSLTGGFAQAKWYVDGVTVVIPYLGPQGGYDFRFLAGAGGGRFGAKSFGAPVAGAYNNLDNLNNLSGQQGGSSVGLFCPLTGNNDDCTFESFVAQGFVFGLNYTEHCVFGRYSGVYDVVGIQCVGGGAHTGGRISYASVENCFAAAQFTGTSPFTLSIGVLDCETITGFHVQDTQQALYGEALVHTNSGVPSVLGARNMRVIWDGLGPGVWSGAPAAPAAGVSQQNTAWRDATVWVTSTAAITAIAVDGNAVFSGTVASGIPLTIRVPSGHTYTVTSAGGTLTTSWVLD